MLPRFGSFTDRRAAAGALAVLALILVLIGPTPLALALTPAEIEAGNQAARRIQQEQEERRLQQLREDAQRRGAETSVPAPEAKAPTLPKSGVCREIKRIDLVGASLLGSEERAVLTALYEGRCLYAEDIERLLGDILKAYMDRGYVAVRPYVRAQDLSDGRLEVLIVEGRVERLELKGGKGWFAPNLATAFPFVQGGPLNLRDIEQGLDQINRLGSNQASMEIEPGEESGASVVVIKNEQSFPLKLSAGMDNLGGLSTGRNQGSYTVSLDSPLGLGDYLTYTRRTTLLERDQYRDARSDSLFYSVPLGYWTFQASYSFSDYHSPVTTASNTLVARGSSESFRAEASYVAYRDQDQKLTLLAAINRKGTRNYLADSFLEVSSRNLTIADADASWQKRLPWASVNLGLGFSQGLRQLNAKADPEGAGVVSPHAQGAKVRYSGGLAVPFSLLGQDVTFSSQVTGQFALEPLYGSEQITLGSFYTVRGFNRHSLSGDRGWYVRNELSTALPALPFTDVVPRPFVAFDGGRVEGFKTIRDASLTGVAGGLRVGGRHVSGELSVAKSLSTPVSLPHEPAQFSATLTASF